MKIDRNYFKMVVLLLVVIGLYTFSTHRGDKKKVENINVKFIGNQNLYLTEETVNKLLTVNYGRIKNKIKEKLDLNGIEKVINANKMVKSVQVYFSVDDKLMVEIVQREPIGRVEGATRFYLDDQGKYMPLSKNHSARVPVITGNTIEERLEEVYRILMYIKGDDFFKKNIIGIHIDKENKYRLMFRMENFVVNLGGIDNMEAKFFNFKAFYSKAIKDGILGNYSKVNLEYKKQVVCTKKTVYERI